MLNRSMAVILNNAEREMVIFLEQRYQERSAWLSPGERATVLLRLHLFYHTLGINRATAMQMEADYTDAADGWRCLSLPDGVQYQVEQMFFS